MPSFFKPAFILGGSLLVNFSRDSIAWGFAPEIGVKAPYHTYFPFDLYYRYNIYNENSLNRHEMGIRMHPPSYYGPYVIQDKKYYMDGKRIEPPVRRQLASKDKNEITGEYGWKILCYKPGENQILYCYIYREDQVFYRIDIIKRSESVISLFQEIKSWAYKEPLYEGSEQYITSFDYNIFLEEVKLFLLEYEVNEEDISILLDLLSRNKDIIMFNIEV